MHYLIPRAGVLWKRIMKKAIICRILAFAGKVGRYVLNERRLQGKKMVSQQSLGDTKKLCHCRDCDRGCLTGSQDTDTPLWLFTIKGY